jgi:hypothetical protein
VFGIAWRNRIRRKHMHTHKHMHDSIFSSGGFYPRCEEMSCISKQPTVLTCTFQGW